MVNYPILKGKSSVNKMYTSCWSIYLYGINAVCVHPMHIFQSVSCVCRYHKKIVGWCTLKPVGMPILVLSTVFVLRLCCRLPPSLLHPILETLLPILMKQREKREKKRQCMYFIMWGMSRNIVHRVADTKRLLLLLLLLLLLGFQFLLLLLLTGDHDTVYQSNR